MPVYEYTGLAAGNRTTRGHVDADSTRAARNKLRADGIFPTSLTEARTKASGSEMLTRFKLPELRKVPDLDLSVFTDQLATLIDAGVPLVESLGSLTEQIENARLKSVVGRVRESVNHGSSLADAFGEHPQVFDDLYTAMVRAGESAGALGLVLQRLADYVEDRRVLQAKVASAAAYPAFMVVMVGAAAIFLMIFVLPRLTTVLLDLNVELPLITRIVIATSSFVGTYWPIIVFTPVLAFLAINRFINTTPGRAAWDRFKLKLPLIGRVSRFVAISRFTKTLSTLLGGGLNIVHALEISKQVAGNIVIGEAVEGAKEAITKGASIAAPLRASGEFPPMVTHMVAVGEASGQLDAMLEKVSHTYDTLVDNSIERFTSLLGPILLFVVAFLVAIIMVSILLPLISMFSAF